MTALWLSMFRTLGWYYVLPKQNVAYCNIKIYTLLPLKIEK